MSQSQFIEHNLREKSQTKKETLEVESQAKTQKRKPKSIFNYTKIKKNKNLEQTTKNKTLEIKSA